LSVACLNVEQGFVHIIDWELSALFFSDEYNADCVFEHYKVDEKLLPILRLGEEWGRSDVLLQVLQYLFVGWCLLEIFGLS